MLMMLVQKIPGGLVLVGFWVMHQLYCASLNGYRDFFFSVLGVEAMATYEGLRLASKMDISYIMIISNSLTMIQILQRTSEPLLEVANQVTDIKNSLAFVP